MSVVTFSPGQPSRLLVELELEVVDAERAQLRPAEVEDLVPRRRPRPGQQVQSGCSRRGGSCRSRSPMSHALQQLVGDVRVAGGGDSVGNQSRPEKMPFSTVPGLTCARPADDRRDAEAALVDRALGGPERRHAAVRPGEDLGAVVGGEDDDRVVGLADVLEVLHAARRCCRPSAPCRPLRGRSWSGCSSSPGTWATGRSRRACASVLCQTKNGLPSALALSMKRSQSRPAPRRRSPCCTWPWRHVVPVLPFAMSGNGGSGPSSTIRCLPILPQRGISVGSSVSVAQECTRLRGPTCRDRPDPSGRSTSTGPTWRRGGRDSRRTRRSRARVGRNLLRSPRWFLPNWPVA